MDRLSTTCKQPHYQDSSLQYVVESEISIFVTAAVWGWFFHKLTSELRQGFPIKLIEEVINTWQNNPFEIASKITLEMSSENSLGIPSVLL